MLLLLIFNFIFYVYKLWITFFKPKYLQLLITLNKKNKQTKKCVKKKQNPKKKKNTLITVVTQILINMLFNTHFILASSSSSRYKILKNNNLYFTRIKPHCNENVLKKKLIKIKRTPREISLELARLKAKSISARKNSELIVGSDTVISFRGRLINKAKNFIEAKTKILKLSGKSHDIYSSASVFLNQRELWKSTQKSTIIIRRLTEKEVDNYLSFVGKQILSSVGCYQVESLGPNIIESVKGDYFNIMGFPLFPFLLFLKEYKFKDL